MVIMTTVNIYCSLAAGRLSAKLLTCTLLFNIPSDPREWV